MFRTMDADVTNDPLFDVAVGEEKNGQTRVSEALKANAGKIVTGGYNWDTSGLEGNPVLRDLITIINDLEHKIRERMIKHGMQYAVYAPEPNTYIPAAYKPSWDAGLTNPLKSKKDFDRQMGESTKGRKETSYAELAHHAEISVTKPRKEWLKNYEPLAEAWAAGDKEAAKLAFDILMDSAHQSYLRIDVAEKIAAEQSGGLESKHKEMLSAFLGRAHAGLWRKLEAELLTKAE